MFDTTSSTTKLSLAEVQNYKTEVTELPPPDLGKRA